MRNDTEALLQSRRVQLPADGPMDAAAAVNEKLFMHHKAAVQEFIDHHRQSLLSHIFTVKSK